LPKREEHSRKKAQKAQKKAFDLGLNSANFAHLCGKKDVVSFSVPPWRK
jgi:hypothetical protein